MKKRLLKKAALAPEDYIQGYRYDYEHVDVGVQTVNVNDIIGLSAERQDQYDDNFYPIGEPDARWNKLYNKAKEEGNLDFTKPVHLVKAPNEEKYFVYDDGNHRVSVAKTLGFPTIQAEITALIPKSGEAHQNFQQQYEEVYSQIRELEQKLQEYNKQQQELYNTKGLTIDQIDAKFDEIEKVKEPIYTQVDNMYADLDKLRLELANNSTY